MGPMPGRSALCRILLGICVACLYPGCQGSTFNISLSTETFVRDCVGRENEKFFVLSFDDGPASYTEPILDVLKEKGVPATFFLIGSQFERFPESSEKYKELILRMLEEGHIPANHGIDNDEFTLDDVEACHETIASITDGYKMKYFRPAQGAYTIEKYEELIERNYKMIMWNLDIQDWRKEKSTETMLEEVKMAVKNSTFLPPEDDTANHDLPRRGSYIMLAHDNQGKMLQIVPGGQTLLATMIDEIRDAGYEIVSLDKCLGDEDDKIDNGNYCGTDFLEAQQCGVGKCPSGWDSDCPGDTRCFGDVLCPSTQGDNSSPSATISMSVMSVLGLITSCSLTYL